MSASASQDSVRTPKSTARSGAVLRRVLLGTVVLAFTAAAWSSRRNLGVLWDEEIDFRIARDLINRPLYGGGLDGTQTRLPMYLNAAVFAIASPSLGVARGISVAVGAAALLVTFAFGRRLFDAWTGLLAAALLGFSPYFLSFSRIAMTEGDVFPALFVTLACLAYIGWSDEPRGSRLAVAGAFLGLAIGAKLYSLFLMPVFGFCEHARMRRRGRRDGAPLAVAGNPVPARAVACLIGAVASFATSALLAQVGQVGPSVAGWVLAVGFTLATFIALCRAGGGRAGASRSIVTMSLLGVAVACAACPEHVINPEIARAIARRTVRWDHVVPGSLWWDHLRLYSGIVLIKATVPIGLASAAALVWAWIREGDQARLRVPIFGVTFFVLAVSTLPLRQTFYLMSVYPLLMILTAAWLTACGRRLACRSRLAGRCWWGFTCVLVAQLVIASGRAWPDYNLYGRRLIGDRWLGAEARGYRNLIQPPCDGYAEVAQWCMAHVEPGKRVVSFLWADHILDRFFPPDTPFVLVRRGVFRAANLGEPAPSPPSIDDADYILLHIDNVVEYQDAPPPDRFREFFGDRPVFTVFRDGDFPMAMIYRRH